jgi:hypothetical protein
VLEVTPEGLKVVEICADIDFDELQKLSGVPLIKDVLIDADLCRSGLVSRKGCSRPRQLLM